MKPIITLITTPQGEFFDTLSVAKDAKIDRYTSAGHLEITRNSITIGSHSIKLNDDLSETPDFHKTRISPSGTVLTMWSQELSTLTVNVL